MALLRLVTLCTVLSTALSFVAMAPPTGSKPLAAARPAATAAAWGVQQRRGRVASALNAGKGDMRMAMERTYIMAKPDAVQRGIVSDIINRFEKRGFKLVALKLAKTNKEILAQHYQDLTSKPFWPKLESYMLSGPVVAMVWEGKDVVATGRKMLGATNPLESAPGTIRGDFSIEVGRNICHGSDSVESANREIALWFPEGVIDWASHSHDWIYE